MDLIKIGRYITYILRHHPESIGIELDEHGWARVDELIQGVSKKYPIDMNILEEIVRTDNKGRHSFNEDKTLIRANQGHTVKVNVELQEVVPPTILYHGTATKYVNSIDSEGLISKKRLHVHLSSDLETAIKVGKRHGDVVVYKVLSEEMYKDGYVFYLSVNGVWLVSDVPVRYLLKQKVEENLY